MLHVHFALALRQMSTFHCRPKKKVCMFFFVFAGGTLSFVLLYIQICLHVLHGFCRVAFAVHLDFLPACFFVIHCNFSSIRKYLRIFLFLYPFVPWASAAQLLSRANFLLTL